MKKNKIFMIAALIASVFAFTGCGELWDAAKGVTKNKWTKVTVKSKAANEDMSDTEYDLDVYLYYTDENKSEGNIDLQAGLNVLIEANAGNAKFFGSEMTTASYAIKTFAPNTEISDADGKKSFKVNDDAWAAAYALGMVKSSGAPKAKSDSSYTDVREKLSADYWKEFMAEKIIEFLLGE